jgi:hypothetical protein
MNCKNISSIDTKNFISVKIEIKYKYEFNIIITMNLNLNRRLKRLEDICATQPLEEYYNIQNTNDRKLKISYIRTSQHKISLGIYFEKSRFYDFLGLPQEVSRIIFEYAPTIIDIKVEIDFSNDYPFIQPNYSLIQIEHNHPNTPINLEEYYKYIIDNHNYQYSKYWSPAILIDRDILDFVRKVNHFEYLV